MGKIVRFPERHHVRTSCSRAARLVSKAADIPLERAFSVKSKEAQYSAGMLSRCHHLDTWAADTPGSSTARPSRDFPQSSMMLRNVVKLVMPKRIGPSVLKRKAFLSLDQKKSVGHTVPMSDSETEAEYKQAFMQRVKEARIARGLKQWEMAEALVPGMPQDKYKQYEGRSLLPHHLMGRFCLICRVDPEWLLTGKGKKALKPLREIEAPASTKPVPVRKKSVKRRVA